MGAVDFSPLGSTVVHIDFPTGKFKNHLQDITTQFFQKQISETNSFFTTSFYDNPS